MRPLTGGARIANALVANKVKALFGIPGTHTVPIYRALQELQPAITTITTRHESGAGYAADGYARQTGELAAVCVVTGIGLTNTITPMAAALADSVPMLVISSEVPSFWSARPARQYSHFVPRSDSIAAAVSKRSFSVDAVDDIDAAVAEACELARSGRPGPVHLSVPIDVLAATSTTARASSPPDGVHGGAADGRGAGGARRGGRRVARRRAPGRHRRRRRARRAAAALAGRSTRRCCARWRARARCTRATRSRRARLHHPLAREALLDEADALLLVGTQLSPTDYWQFAHTADMSLPPSLLRRATHVDLDPASLEQGGVGRAAGGPCSPTPPSRATLLDSLAAHGGGGRGRWGGGVAEVIAAAKASADAPAALSETLMWTSRLRPAAAAWCARSARCARGARRRAVRLRRLPAGLHRALALPVARAQRLPLPGGHDGARLRPARGGRRRARPPADGDAGPVVAIVGDGGLQLSAGAGGGGGGEAAAAPRRVERRLVRRDPALAARLCDRCPARPIPALRRVWD